MTKINLYKHGNAVGPRSNGPDDPIHGYRLVADEGKMLSNGGEFVFCVDILPEEENQWMEVDVYEL